LRPVEINVSGKFARSKIAWKLATYQHVLLHRLVANMDGAAVACNNRCTLSAMLSGSRSPRDPASTCPTDGATIRRRPSRVRTSPSHGSAPRTECRSHSRNLGAQATRNRSRDPMRARPPACPHPTCQQHRRRSGRHCRRSGPRRRR
jgi:hypothetical protein